MTVYLRRSGKRTPAFDRKLLLREARAMLKALKLESHELSVLLTDDRTIHELNLRYRQKDKPTDVLSFEQPQASGPNEPLLLGDVVISLETAERQARARKRPLAAEVRFLLAHGLGHLVGHDHATPAQKRLMDALTRRLVRATLTLSSG